MKAEKFNQPQPTQELGKIRGQTATVLLVVLSLTSCAMPLNYAKTEPIGTGRFDIRAAGLGYQEKWKEEAAKACPKGYAIVERVQCGDSCWQGSIKCE